MQGEVDNGKVITSQLEQIRIDMSEIVKRVQEIATGAIQSNTAPMAIEAVTVYLGRGGATLVLPVESIAPQLLQWMDT